MRFIHNQKMATKIISLVVIMVIFLGLIGYVGYDYPLQRSFNVG